MIQADRQADNTNNQGERRKSIRHRTIYAGKVLHQGRTYKCTLFDLSVEGTKIKGLAGFNPGDGVEVFIDRLGNFTGVKAEVAWVSNETIGLKFTDNPTRLKRNFARLLPSRIHLEKQNNE